MRSKVRVGFLAILMVAMAGAAQAEIIPMVQGYTTSYEVNWAGVTPSKYNASMTITADPLKEFGGKQWLTMQQYNWDGDGKTQTMLMFATNQAVYVTDPNNPQYDSLKPHFK